MIVSPVNDPEAPGRTRLPPAIIVLEPLLLPVRLQAPLATVKVEVDVSVTATVVAELFKIRAPMVALAGAGMANAAVPVAVILMMSLGDLTAKVPAALHD